MLCRGDAHHCWLHIFCAPAAYIFPAHTHFARFLRGGGHTHAPRWRYHHRIAAFPARRTGQASCALRDKRGRRRKSVGADVARTPFLSHARFAPQIFVLPSFTHLFYRADIPRIYVMCLRLLAAWGVSIMVMEEGDDGDRRRGGGGRVAAIILPRGLHATARGGAFIITL